MRRRYPTEGGQDKESTREHMRQKFQCASEELSRRRKETNQRWAGILEKDLGHGGQIRTKYNEMYENSMQKSIIWYGNSKNL